MGSEPRTDRDQVIQMLVRWGKDHTTVRAMLLTSTRAIPDGPLDLFSDYDVILVVSDILPFYESRTWLDDFGEVLVLYRDPLKLFFGEEKFAYITQYEDGLKIDFTIWPVETIARIVAAPAIPDDLDVGYQVLLDKDALTANLKPPSYEAFLPTPPDGITYHRVIEEFFHETTYVAKLLWRDELLPAKHSLDNVIKLNYLRQMLEWQIGIENNWGVKTGAYGKGLKRKLDPETWSELERTYTGADIERNWIALFATIDLFRKVAVEVGDRLGYEYPLHLDEGMMDYLRRVQTLEAGAESFQPGGAHG